MSAALAWIAAFLTPFAPTFAAWLAPKAPIPAPPKPSRPTVDDGDAANRAAAKRRAEGGP